MSKSNRKIAAKNPDALFERVVSILEQARGNVVRAVNSNMVLAYWLIGREIVQQLQGGEKRAEYGKQVVDDLSARLTERYGKGYSSPVLWSFRQFFQVYSSRYEILFPAGRELAATPISCPAGTQFSVSSIPSPLGIESTQPDKGYPTGSQSPQGFSPQLSWSHYRALMRVDNLEARDFYEREAVAGAWDKRTLERQIQSFYYERILKSRRPEKMLAEGRKLPIPAVPAGEALKHPYVLEFLRL